MDPYVYPGTIVLRNLRNLRDPDQLAGFEGNSSTRRAIELAARPQNGSFDPAHVQAIHRYLFQDVYYWAGEFRTVNISRSGQFPYAFPQQIEPSLQSVATALRSERHLAGLDAAAFCRRAGHYLGELNAIHPFRDGNGRTLREFIRQLAAQNKFRLDWSRLSREQVYEASQRSFQRGDNSRLEQILRSALDQAFRNLTGTTASRSLLHTFVSGSRPDPRPTPNHSVGKSFGNGVPACNEEHF